MNKIISKEQFSEKVFKFEVEAPLIARSRKAGHFVIVRVDAKGERMPLTIAGADVQKGTITLVVQEVGLSSTKLCQLNAGDYILDVVGPLGQATHIENFGTVVCAGGGVGVAPMLPIIQALKEARALGRPATAVWRRPCAGRVRRRCASTWWRATPAAPRRSGKSRALSGPAARSWRGTAAARRRPSWSSSSRARAGSMRLPVCAVERLPRRMSLYGVRRRGLQHTEKIRGKPKIRRRFSPDFFISPNLLLYTKNILL